MEYIKQKTSVCLKEDTVLSLGKFDGLHTGHKFLLEHMYNEKAAGLKSAIFTFDMQPEEKITNQLSAVLTTPEEKEIIFSECGIDYLIECPFTDEIRGMEAQDFVKKIVNELRAKSIVVGSDFHFGHNRVGDYRLLESLSKTYGYRLQVVEKMKYRGREISSTFIREEIQKGNMKLANQLLGYDYFVQGEVEFGNQIGRKMETPTANLIPEAHKLLPPFGVYAVQVKVGEKWLPGIANIGRKPTIGDHQPVGVETHIFDFDEELYGQTIRVSLLDFIRPEQRFSNIEKLQEQISKDIKQCKMIFGTSR